MRNVIPISHISMEFESINLSYMQGTLITWTRQFLMEFLVTSNVASLILLKFFFFFFDGVGAVKELRTKLKMCQFKGVLTSF